MSSWNETTARITWQRGVSIADFGRSFDRWFAHSGLRFFSWSKSECLPFRVVQRGELPSLFLRNPWEDPPRLAEPSFQALTWALLDRDLDRPWWGSFGLHREENPDGLVRCVRFGFDGLLDAPDLSPAEFERMVKTYHGMRSLFRELDCDLFIGAGVNHTDTVDDPGADPRDEFKTFRFAKHGPELLVRAMEERRPLRPDEQATSRIRTPR